jgi:hypothetical protein
VTGEISPAQNLPRDIFRGILEPMFGGIDCNNANWCDVLFGHQISDSGFYIPLSEDASIVTEAINDKIQVAGPKVAFNASPPITAR